MLFIICSSILFECYAWNKSDAMYEYSYTDSYEMHYDVELYKGLVVFVRYGLLLTFRAVNSVSIEHNIL